MDNTIETVNHVKEPERLKLCMGKEFEIKELRRLNYFLEIEVAWSS